MEMPSFHGGSNLPYGWNPQMPEPSQIYGGYPGSQPPRAYEGYPCAPPPQRYVPIGFKPQRYVENMATEPKFVGKHRRPSHWTERRDTRKKGCHDKVMIIMISLLMFAIVAGYLLFQRSSTAHYHGSSKDHRHFRNQ